MPVRWRTSVAKALPSAIAFSCFAVLTGGSLWSRIISGLGAALIAPLLGGVAVIIGYHLHAKISGNDSAVDRLDFNSNTFIGGVIASTLVWIALAFSHEYRIRSLEQCATLEMQKNGVETAGEAIRTCRSDFDEQSSDAY